MAKLLIIPDVHGIDSWKESVCEALLTNDVHIIFLGDYVDSFTIDTYKILDNLYEIIKLKKIYPDRITLLLGNHDYAYVFGKVAISGFNFVRWANYRQAFNDNWDLFDLAWGFQGQYKYTLITHAGLTESFFREVVRDITDKKSVMYDVLINETDISWIDMPLHTLLNYFKDQCGLMWQIGLERWGIYESGSIIWADRRELINDSFKGIDQIVGHTALNSLEIVKTKNNDNLYFTDIHTDTNLTVFKINLE